MNSNWDSRKSGNKFRGEVNPETDMPDGRGFKVFANGGAYEGNFQENQMHGYGRGVAANGNCYEGLFDSNEMHGYGIYLDNQQGKRLEGHWK